MKLISVQTSDSGDPVETLIEESDSLTHLKTVGLERVSNSNKKTSEWLDCSPPTMGDNKLKDREIRLTLQISEHQYLVVQS